MDGITYCVTYTCVAIATNIIFSIDALQDANILNKAVSKPRLFLVLILHNSANFKHLYYKLNNSMMFEINF